MRVTFWGVRGSCPVPGPSTVRYGGNTPCIEVRCGDDQLVILDAGTGIRALGKSLLQEGFGQGEGEAHILLSHTHHDHIYGMPYFDPFYVPGNRLHIYGPDRPDIPLRELLADWMSSPFHPAPLHSLQASLEFVSMRDGGSIELDGLTIRAAAVNHTTLCNAYRIESDGTAIGYVTDTGRFSGSLLLPQDLRKAVANGTDAEGDVLSRMREQLIDLMRGCRLLIYDTMFDAAELAERPSWGHSSAEEALDICRAAEIGHLSMFHHSPDCSDVELDARLAQARAMADGLQVSSAREGETLYLR